MAQILFTSITGSSFYAYISELDTGYGRDDRYIDWYIDGSYCERVTLSAGDYQSDLVYFDGLSGGTVYTVKAVIYYTDSGQYITKTLTDDCTTKNVRPAYFSWHTEKNSGKTFNLTADEWNELTANINAVRQYHGYSNYSFTTAYKKNSFTATMYNQAVYAIQGIDGYGVYISTVSKGQKIYASHLNNLVSELNAIP